MASPHPSSRSGQLVREPAAPPPGPGFIRALEDPFTWCSADGVRRRIEEMTTEHLWNLLGYCRYHAPALIAFAGLAPDPEPSAVLAPRPTLRAVTVELAARDEAGDIDAALAILRAGGRFPWEDDRDEPAP
ncbi:MAG: hypothetical protein ACKOTZ_00375 [Chloroflexota bacterium]